MTDRLPSAGSDGWLAIGLLVALAGAGRTWETVDAPPGIDFHLVWIATDVVRNRVVADLYRDQDSDAVMNRYIHGPAADKSQARRQKAAAATKKLGLMSTPVLYATLAAVTSGDYERDYRRYQFLSLAAFLLAVLLLGRMVGLSIAASLTLFGVLSVAFGPVGSDVRVGNVNRLQLALLAVSACGLARSRSMLWTALGGFVLGWAVLFKPNMIGGAAALAVWWAAGRRMRPLLAAGAGGLAAVLVAMIVSRAFFGSLSCWSSWYHAATHLRDWYQADASMGNVGLMEILRTATGRDLSLVLMCVFGLAVLVTAWLARLPARSEDESFHARQTAEQALLVAVLTAGCAIWLESAWLTWLHYYVMLTPLVLFALRPLGAVRWAVRGAARGAGVIAVVALYPATLRLLPGATLQSWANVINFAVGLLLAFVLVDLVRVARTERAAESAGRRP